MSVDWNVLKTDYVVHGELSLAALAKKYEVYRVVCETAEREHWKEERELHASRFSTKLWLWLRMTKPRRLRSHEETQQ